MVRMPFGGAASRVSTRWRSSLYLRVVATTLALSVLVVVVLGQILIGRITSGLLDAKQRASLVEAQAGINQAQALIAASGEDNPEKNQNLVQQVAVELAPGGQGTPRLYDVLLLSSSASLLQRGSSTVTEASVPAELRDAVQVDGVQASTFTEIVYSDGQPPVPGFAVGAPLIVPSLGTAELYYLFPLVQEQQTLDLVRRTLLFAGLVLVLLLSWISWFVTRQVVDPVRYAVSIAEEFSAGHLSERMKVRGEDDLARLARSFNDMAASLEVKIGQLEDLSRVQRRFVSDVSHELRTPLTTVRMAADVLHEGRDEFDPATARSAELLQTQLDRFEALLADLLEISRFDAGAATLDAVKGDLRDAVSAVVEALSPLAERSSTEIRVHLSTEPAAAEYDPRRVDRILRNLLANAIEHGEGHPIDISVASSADAVAIVVRDHGAGLRPGESSLVFNRFWRADPSRVRSIGGTGLGLSIALEDARLHGGWLQAWGSPGDGASFRLTLPHELGIEISASPLTLEPADASTRRRMPLSVGAGVPSQVPERRAPDA
ncbi:MAG: HAMP domain-containing histidine kinase [Actinomycetia bacterium]|nr:HAMP domain-containing histidine kinase [Actinomycetes bacterium]